jgi:restriction system protein
MLGRGSAFAKQAFADGFIGADYLPDVDLTTNLPDDWHEFNKAYIPVYLEARPDKTRIGAGLACGALWSIAKGINQGDVVLSPDGFGHYRVGDVTGDYEFRPGEVLPHRRKVQWREVPIDRAAMSEALRRSTGSMVTVTNITGYVGELDSLMGSGPQPAIISTIPEVEDPAAFALEKHLEDFLVQNWKHTELGKSYSIFEEDGEQVGQQYPTDTGPIDILAIRNDRTELLVLELKKGRASDTVVGQVLRYMGFVAQELAEPGQSVRGVIIALDDDQRIRRALAAVPTVDFYRYQVAFELLKVASPPAASVK